MNTLIVIMAHRDIQPTFDRHLYEWEKHGHDIVVYCPKDSIVDTHHRIWAFGPRGHHGADANKRFKELIYMLALTTYERFMICEYDSYCLSPVLPFFRVDAFHDALLCGNVFRDDRPDRGFIGTTFIHPPLILTKSALSILVPALKALADECERGFWDRMLGLACEERGIPTLDFLRHGLGFSRNTIEAADIASMVAAVRKGAVMIHGVKDQEVHRRLVETFQAGTEMKVGLDIRL